MSVTLDQIETLKRATPLLQAIIDLVATYEKVGSIEQAVDESNARLSRARAAEGEFKAKFVTERDEIEAMRKTAAAVTEQANSDAATILASAQAQGDRLYSAAVAEVAKQAATIDEQKAVLEALVTAELVASEHLGELRAKAAEFEATVDAKKAELRALLGG